MTHRHAETIVIERRFRGPPDSANGGYACGIVARRIEGTSTVRLHVPPPLDQPMLLTADDGHAALHRDDVLVAAGAAAPHDVEAPAPVAYDDAVEATSRFRWHHDHPFPGCFVCGPERHAGDGLCIFPGAVVGRTVVAAPWVPDASVVDDAGRARPEVVWAALDCPSWFGLLAYEAGATTALLGQLSAQIVRAPRQGERCVVIGWSRGRDGRKLYGGAALFPSDGDLLGSSAATWIEPRA
jgi:hypothetical protein